MTMDLLLDPNVAFVLLVLGFLISILALFDPGTGIVEIGALFAIVLAGISIYNLPTNTWALVLLILGVIPFLLALRYSRQYIFLILSMVALAIGSIFLFRSPDGGLAIDPLLAILVLVLSTGFMWLIGTKGLEAISRTPTHDLQRLMSMTGIASTEIMNEGTVYLDGEDWSAQSSGRIPEGAKVRVIGRQGLTLVIEQVDEQSSTETLD